MNFQQIGTTIEKSMNEAEQTAIDFNVAIAEAWAQDQELKAVNERLIQRLKNQLGARWNEDVEKEFRRRLSEAGYGTMGT